MSVDARHVGHTTSPHEEAAVEIAVQTAEATGGSATVLTLGPGDAEDQLRDAIAVGCTRAVHIEADSEQFGPADVAAAIAQFISAEADPVDLVLVGTDAADTGDFQVGVRLAYALERPVLTGIANCPSTATRSPPAAPALRATRSSSSPRPRSSRSPRAAWRRATRPSSDA